MTVKHLKNELKDALRILDKYNDEQEVNVVSNTYSLGDCYTFLGISGYYGGYINLDHPVSEDDEEDEY